MRKREIFWLSFIAVVFITALSANAEVNAGKPETDVRGCLCKYNSMTGKVDCNNYPFVKTADKLAPAEDGEAEIWGYFYSTLGQYEHEPDKNGIVKPVNVRADMFVPGDGKAHEVRTGTIKRRVKCECWQQKTTVTASR